MSPTVKKLAADSLARYFAEAEEAPAISEEDRAALAEAAADPEWLRVSRGDFERLVCDDDE